MNHNRKNSTYKAVRWQHDVYDMINNLPVAGESFSEKIHRFVRKHAKPTKPKKIK